MTTLDSAVAPTLAPTLAPMAAPAATPVVARAWAGALHRLGLSALVVGLSALSGCVLWMRDADYYASELEELLETQDEAIAACYDGYLEAQDPKARGRLTVSWQVEKRTGAFTQVSVVTSETTVPEPLAQCVTDQLAGMKLEPADAKTGQATYTWEFTPGSRKPRPADPFQVAQIGVLACYSDHLANVDRTAQGDVVVDYAFDQATGELTQLELIADATTAPELVVECAVEVLKAATVDPAQLESRNLAGRRRFALRFEPWIEPGEPEPSQAEPGSPEPS